MIPSSNSHSNSNPFSNPPSSDSSLTLTKAERRELKRLQNLEWKWKRGRQGEEGEEEANLRYTEYYQRQLPEIFHDWSLIRETLAKDLPVTFRLCAKRNSTVCQFLKSRFQSEVILSINQLINQSLLILLLLLLLLYLLFGLVSSYER